MREHFNDANREEPSRYVAEQNCDYMIDLFEEGQSDNPYATSEEWEVCYWARADGNGVRERCV